MGETRGVEAVERALLLLLAFRAPGEALSLAELAARTGFYKSTILRLFVSLERFGCIRRERDGRYRLGVTMARLGALAPAEDDHEALIRPVLAAIAQETGETAAFYIRRGPDRICRFRHNSAHAARHHLEEGQALPLDQGAAGHVLHAWGGGEGVRAAQIRAAGHATSEGERDPEVHAVAMPVFRPNGQLEGALSVSGLKARMGPEDMARALASISRHKALLEQALREQAPAERPGPRARTGSRRADS